MAKNPILSKSAGGVGNVGKIYSTCIFCLPNHTNYITLSDTALGICDIPCVSSAEVETAHIHLQASLAPNPTSGATALTLSADVRRYAVQVADLAGRVLIALAGQNGAVSLPTESLAPGTYIVRTASEKGVAVQKLVKE